MQRGSYIPLAAAWLCATSLQAPFAHVHPEDPEHHHAQGFGHFHLSDPAHAEAASGSEIEPHDADDEPAVWLEWAPAAPQRLAVPQAEAPSSPLWQARWVDVGPVPELIPRSHGPPALRLPPARSPPF